MVVVLLCMGHYYYCKKVAVSKTDHVYETPDFKDSTVPSSAGRASNTYEIPSVMTENSAYNIYPPTDIKSPLVV